MFDVLLDMGANIVRWSIIELSFSLKKNMLMLYTMGLE